MVGFSTHVSPDLARGLTSRLSRPAGRGFSYQLDLTLLTDFSKEAGIGFSLAVQTP